MYSNRTFILFPKIDDYSSIHEWPLIHSLGNLSHCTLQPYCNNNDFIKLIHNVTQNLTTHVILIFGNDEQWQFLNATLTNHPNCTLKAAPSPYNFYARINESIHIIGLANTEQSLTFIEKQLTTYYTALAPTTLWNLSKQVGTALSQAGLTISCAESCTGGLIAKTLTDVSGASAYFYGGACTYSASIKMQVLHVEESTITNSGIVSKETAQSMAEGAQALFGTDIALSTTGVAGPGADTDDNPEGLVYCCIAINDKRYVYRYLASDETLCTDRPFIRSACVIFILKKLLEHLLQH